jgi:Helix-turn-helix
MISPILVAEVKRLLAQPGLSQRKVALMTGVSRASVSAIAAGRRRDYPDRCNPTDDEDEIPRGPAERCPTCGGLVFMPCQLCRIRDIKAEERQRLRSRADAGASWHPSESR